MRFTPTRCPYSDCPSRETGRFRWHRRGTFLRKCDGRRVQRFYCHLCRRRFSTQTFRLDYRLHKPALTRRLFVDFVGKVTHRQSARQLGCSRSTVAHRLLLVGRHCRDFHLDRLERALRGGRALSGCFQLDELETFEHNRRLAPVTVPVLIEQSTFFVLAADAAPLPARGRLSPENRRKKALREKRHGKRRSGSRAAVTRAFALLARFHRRSEPVVVRTDRKHTYRAILRRLFGDRLDHSRFSSKRKRNYGSPLFAIDHTLAMLRDGVSRLVRRSWAAAKQRQRLLLHLWIWIAYRNYVRGITNAAPRITSAMALGVSERKLRTAEVLAWRICSRPAS